MSRIFLTGVTGFVGRFVAARLLARDEVEGLDVLVRADGNQHARERLLASMRHAVPEHQAVALVERMTPVIGDLRSERLGLSESDWDELAARTDHEIGRAHV